MLAADVPFHNVAMPTDVNMDGYVTPSDALLVINALNARGDNADLTAGLADTGSGPLAASLTSDTMVDVDGNNLLTPRDVLLVFADLHGETEMQFRMETTNVAGEPITSARVGETFQLRVYVQDIRDEPHGVFAAFLDVTYDSALATADDATLTHGPSYPNFQLGDATTPGIIDEVGATAGSTELGGDEFLLFQIDVTADAEGTLTFTGDPADVLPTHEILFFDQPSDEVPPDHVDYGTATIQITVLAANDTFTVAEDSGETMLDVLANDGEDEEMLTITAVGTPSQGGTVTIATDGQSLLYTPEPDFFGLETFTYTVESDEGEIGQATVTLAVTPTNDLPTAVDDTFTVDEDSTDEVLDVLDNDSIAPDVAEELMIVSVGTPSQGGTVTIASDGQTLLYTPGTNFFGTETFTYTINDETEGSNDTATVSVTVAPTNDPPTAVDDTFDVAEDSVDAVLEVLDNDTNDPDATGTVTIVSVGTPDQGGTVTIAGDGETLLYTPAANFNGTETFTYTIEDGTEGSNDTATVSITVTPLNDLPTAEDDEFAVLVNSAEFALDVLTNDSDAPDSGEVLTVIEVGTPSQGGTVTIAEGGLGLIYTPDTDFVGTETFTYTINDGTTDSNATATVTITVGEIQDDEFTVDEDADETSLDVLANDGVDESAMITAVGTPDQGGTVTVSPDGQAVLYTPADDFFGTETFTYTVEINGGETAEATVTVTVTPVNDLPTAVDDTFTEGVDEDSSDNVLDVLANDTFEPDEGETLTIVEVGTPDQGGTVTIAGDGQTLLYTPADDFNGTETFTYTINDGTTGSDSTATVTVTVGALNDPPTAEDDTFSTPFNSMDVALDVLANDSDAPDTGETLTIIEVGTPSQGGTVTIAEGGQGLIYTPETDFTGTETFTYTINDGTPDSDATATVTITVNPPNSPPTANSDVFSDSVDEDDVEVDLDVLANDTIAPDTGETLTVTAVGTPDNGGTVTIAPDGMSVLYTPAANFFGFGHFTYTISDGNGGMDTANVTVFVSQVNDPPTANDDAFDDIDEDSSGNTLDVLDNDSLAPDPNGTLTIVSVGETSNGGSVTIAGDGQSLLYTPAANFFGTETFTYTINDGNEGSNDTATVTVTVDNVNDDPTANDDSFGLEPDAGETVVNVLQNDTSDPDSAETLTITEITQGNQGGTVAIEVGGDNILYTPAAGFTGSETFTYTISDGNGGTDTATVTMTITSEPLPQAEDDAATVDEDSLDTVIDVLANDLINPSGEVVVTSLGTPSQGGTVVVASDNTILYTPAANFHGTETFTYTINDGVGEPATATATITVTSVNDPPVATDDTFGDDDDILEDTSGHVLDVLDNDTFAPDTGETLEITAVGTPSQGGTVTIEDDTLVYTPAANFAGTETFTYTISDGNGGTDTATVTVEVTAVNDPPNAVNDTFNNIQEDSTNNTLNVLVNDTADPDTGETLTITSVGMPSQSGTVTIASGGGSLTYTPGANFTGTETFTYTISDGHGGTDTATVTVNVQSVNDPPTATDDTFAVNANDGTQTFNVLSNDSFAPDTGETLTILSVGTPSQGGMVTIASGGGSLSYTPASGFTGTETFTYTISDGNGGTDMATVTVTVTDFEPSSISGFVFVDRNNDGVRQSDEMPLGGVTVRLQGTGGVSSVNVTQVTAADGSYSFGDLAPGTYTVTETQPAFMMDGIDSINVTGGTVDANDRFRIVLADDTDAANLNFGERGLDTSLLDLRQLLAPPSHDNGVYLVTNVSTGASWFALRDGWDNVVSVEGTLSSNQQSLNLEIVNDDDEVAEGDISLSDGDHIRLLGQQGNFRMYQLIGDIDDYLDAIDAAFEEEDG